MAKAQLLRQRADAMMRKRLLLAGVVVACFVTGTVLAQTSFDGLDLDAINRRAQAEASELAALIGGVVARQNEAGANQSAAQSTVDAANAKLAEVGARISSAPSTAGAIDLDTIVGDAARSLQPPAPPSPQFLAFASLSMPEDSLRQMIDDVSRAGGVIVFRGFAPQGPGAFMKGLSQAIAPGTKPHISIDPRLFKAFNIEAAPTYIALSAGFVPCAGADCVSTPPPFDRLAGNVTTAFALETIADGQGPGAPIARTASNVLKAKP